MHTITLDELKEGLGNALSVYQIAGLTRRDDKMMFDTIEDVNELEWEYSPTVLSPKKYFFPQEETILEYNADGKIRPRIAATPLVLFGIRPCDINAIRLLDEAFSESNGDPNYLEKRQKSVIIGIDCDSVCDDNAFCFKVKTQDAETGADIMLRADQGKYVVKILTEKGDTFVQKYWTVKQGGDKSWDRFGKTKKANFKKAGSPFKNLDRFPAIFQANKEHAIWDQEAKRCLSCGSCIMVCPTCYCFDVADELSLNLDRGQRLRYWDACMLSSFAKVAGGENFREETQNRLKHRIGRKFNYLMQKHGRPVCVGCGRCVRACLADISPLTIAEALNRETAAAAAETGGKTVGVMGKKNDNLYTPEKATVLQVKAFTPRETFLKIDLASGRSLDHEPGQFVQVSVLGIGEAPISVSSPPSSDSTFDLCVRAVGDVTNKLQSLSVGDTLFIRGPFGHGFDSGIMEKMNNKQLLFIAGGIGYVPLRSLINKVVHERYLYQAITILYGVQTPQDLMFTEELDEIARIGENVELRLTADKGDKHWPHNEGVITTLIPQVDFDPVETIAVIVGPPVMYKFVLVSLREKKVPNDQIYMSLERRMKCGVGKCGHCQIEGIYVCQEGPVFNYAEVEDLEEVF